MLEIKDLHVHYGVIPALKGISIAVGEGEIVSIIGANGAGKTTTLHTISGLKKCTSGVISFLEQDLTKIEAHSIVELGLVQLPEGRGVFPNLTVVENLRMGTYLRNDKKAIKEDEIWVYELFPRLLERRGQLAGTLSGGEQQMLAFARALMMRPKLMLLDEPSMGLAPILVEEIFNTITKVNQENGVTMLLVEQNALKALEISHRAYVIEAGEIAISGISSELLDNDSVQKAYLGI